MCRRNLSLGKPVQDFLSGLTPEEPIPHDFSLRSQERKIHLFRTDMAKNTFFVHLLLKTSPALAVPIILIGRYFVKGSLRRIPSWEWLGGGYELQSVSTKERIRILWEGRSEFLAAQTKKSLPTPKSPDRVVLNPMHFLFLRTNQIDEKENQLQQVWDGKKARLIKEKFFPA